MSQGGCGDEGMGLTVPPARRPSQVPGPRSDPVVMEWSQRLQYIYHLHNNPAAVAGCRPSPADGLVYRAGTAPALHAGYCWLGDRRVATAVSRRNVKPVGVH